MIEPEEANEKYGLDGRLKFTEPVSNLEAYVLNERKQQETKTQNLEFCNTAPK